MFLTKLSETDSVRAQLLLVRPVPIAHHRGEQACAVFVSTERPPTLFFLEEKKRTSREKTKQTTTINQQ